MKTRDTTKQLQLTVWYMCHTCSRAFTNVAKLVDHETQYHGVHPISIPNREESEDTNRVQIKFNETLDKVLRSKRRKITKVKIRTASRLINRSRKLRNTPQVVRSLDGFIEGETNKSDYTPEVNSGNAIAEFGVENPIKVGYRDDDSFSQLKDKVTRARSCRRPSTVVTSDLLKPKKRSAAKRTKAPKKNQLTKTVASTRLDSPVSAHNEEAKSAHSSHECVKGQTLELETTFTDSGVFDEGDDEPCPDSEATETCKNESTEPKARGAMDNQSVELDADISCETTEGVDDCIGMDMDDRDQEILSSLKLYECPACTKILKDRVTLMRHVHKACKQCPNCAEKLLELNTFSLEAHVKFYPRCLPLRCHTCDAVFSLSNDYMRHIQLHSAYPGYRCRYCSSFFQLDAEFLAHLNTHEENNNWKHPDAAFPVDIFEVQNQTTTKRMNDVNKTDSIEDLREDTRVRAVAADLECSSDTEFINVSVGANKDEKNIDEMRVSDIQRAKTEALLNAESIDNNNVGEGDDDITVTENFFPQRHCHKNQREKEDILHNVVNQKMGELSPKKKFEKKMKGGYKMKKAKLNLNKNNNETINHGTFTSVSSKSKLIACPICSLTLLTKDLLLLHLTQGCKKCPSCKRKHLDLCDHLNSNADKCLPMKCLPCDRLYFSYTDLRGHALTHAYDSKSFPLLGRQKSSSES